MAAVLLEQRANFLEYVGQEAGSVTALTVATTTTMTTPSTTTTMTAATPQDKQPLRKKRRRPNHVAADLQRQVEDLEDINKEIRGQNRRLESFLAQARYIASVAASSTNVIETEENATSRETEPARIVEVLDDYFE